MLVWFNKAPAIYTSYYKLKTMYIPKLIIDHSIDCIALLFKFLTLGCKDMVRLVSYPIIIKA